MSTLIAMTAGAVATVSGLMVLLFILKIWREAEQRRAHLHDEREKERLRLEHERERERIRLTTPDQQLLIEQEKTKRVKAASEAAKNMNLHGARASAIEATVKQIMNGGE